MAKIGARMDGGTLTTRIGGLGSDFVRAGWRPLLGKAGWRPLLGKAGWRRLWGRSANGADRLSPSRRSARVRPRRRDVTAGR
jgi:hypothetical protein